MKHREDISIPHKSQPLITNIIHDFLTFPLLVRKILLVVGRIPSSFCDLLNASLATSSEHLASFLHHPSYLLFLLQYHPSINTGTNEIDQIGWVI
jgi:hypothetical protein